MLRAPHASPAVVPSAIPAASAETIANCDDLRFSSDAEPGIVVAIRPVGVLEMAKSGAGVPGRIVTKRDAIGIDLCEVQVAGLDRPIELRQRSDPHFAPGNDVFLMLNPNRVLVFKAD